MGTLSKPQEHVVLPDGTWFDDTEVTDRPLLQFYLATEAGPGAMSISFWLLSIVD
ncbi:MAG TPA: hypothetical protein VGJ95_02465 [Pseudonocardiaceae bacterium]|jgi:hypothetical protein